MLSTLPTFQLGAKTFTCAAFFSLRRIQAEVLCVQKTSIMFNEIVLRSGIVRCCRSHFANFVRTSINDTRVIRLWIHVDTSQLAALSAARTVDCISLTQMVIEGCHCSSNVVRQCSAFTEQLRSHNSRFESCGTCGSQ